MIRRFVVTAAALVAVLPAAAVVRGPGQVRAETGWSSPAVAVVGHPR
ncbi:hypothetical protein GCM10009827_072920 [Dactylosporangium maewongense]|uniref:Uncharacterized protein n=1 Tax=Dactylosporangium maewongense TaxID=634393 RepID=A0ABN2BKB4_9ACTN